MFKPGGQRPWCDTAALIKFREFFKDQNRCSSKPRAVPFFFAYIYVGMQFIARWQIHHSKYQLWNNWWCTTKVVLWLWAAKILTFHWTSLRRQAALRPAHNKTRGLHSAYVCISLHLCPSHLSLIIYLFPIPIHILSHSVCNSLTSHCRI